MEIGNLVLKFGYYTDEKVKLEQTKERALAEIEEKVLAKRLALLEQVDAECKQYADELKSEVEQSYAKDYEKVSNYLDLLKELIDENRPSEDIADKEGELNEHNGNDN